MILPAVFLVGLCAGIWFGFCLTCYRRSALRFPRVTVAVIDGRDALLVFTDEHPPWAHSHFYDVAFDYDSKTIDLTEYYVPLHPCSPHVWARPPIVIQQGLMPGRYALRFWDGCQYVEAGRVTVSDQGRIAWDH